MFASFAVWAKYAPRMALRALDSFSNARKRAAGALALLSSGVAFDEGTVRALAATFSKSRTGAVEHLLGDEGIYSTLFVLALLGAKLVATALTVGAGTVGGVFTPTLFLGAAMGSLFGHGLHALGMADALPAGAFALVQTGLQTPRARLFAGQGAGRAGADAGLVHATVTR